MTRDEILADLRAIFGKKTMLSPSDIAEVISQSTNAQAVARHRGRFDIPLRKRGTRIYVSIHDLTDWLCRSEAPTEEATQTEIPTKSIQPRSATPGKPRRPSLAASLMFAQQALAFDTEILQALEKKFLESKTKDTGVRKSKPKKQI